MRKFVVFLIILLVLATIAGIALLNLSRLVNSRKDFFLARAEKVIGREVEAGEIGVTIWGGLAVRVKDVSVSDDPEFSKEKFIESEELQVNVAWFPLIKKELQVKKVTLRRPRIYVIRDSTGRFNFDSLGLPEGAAAGVAADVSQNTSAQSDGMTPVDNTQGGDPARQDLSVSPKRSSFAFFIALANIDEGEVRFVDQGTGSEMFFRSTDLSVKDAALDRPVSARLKASFLAEGEGGGGQNLELTGRVGPVGETPEPSDIPVELELTIDAISLPQAQRIKMLSKLLPPDLALTGPLRTKARIIGKLSSLSVSGKIELTDCSIDLESRFRKPAGMPLQLVSEAHLSGGTAEIKSSTLTLGELVLSGHGTAGLGQPPVVRFNMRSEGMDLSGWGELIPLLVTYDPVGKIDLNLDIDGPVERGSFPKARGHLVVKQASIKLPKAPEPLKWSSGDIVFSTAGEGKLVLADSVRLEGLNGTVKGRGQIDLQETPPKFEFDTHIRDVDLVELIRSSPAGSEKRIQGRTNLDLSFTGHGREWKDIRQSLNGAGWMEVLQGTILEVNIARSLLNSILGQTKSAVFVSDRLQQKYPHVFKETKTVIKELEGDISIEGGRIRTPNLQLQMKDYSILGAGSIGLDWTVDSKGIFVLSPQLSKDLVDEVGYASFLLNAQNCVEVPFSITGTLPKVVLKSDLTGLGGRMQDSVISPEIDKLKNKLLDKFLPSKKRKKK